MTPGLRLALVLPRLSRYGGAEGYGWRLAEAASARGWQVTFVCARQETPAPSGVNVLAVGRPPLPKVFKMLWFSLAAAWVCRGNRFDVVLSLGKTLRQDVCRVSGGPLRIFWRLSERAWPAGPDRTWKRLRRWASPANWLALAIEQRQFVPGAPLAVVSHRVRHWLLEAYPHLRPQDISVIYNEPDLTRFRPSTPEERHAARQRLGLAPETTALLLAGTNFALKGLGPTLEALVHLPPDFHLLVAGGRHPGRFLRQARRLGIHQRVRFLGKVQDMASLYHGVDMVVLPSFYDTCANAVLEARASGLPVVSSADNGSSHFLPPEWVVADPANATNLAHTILVAAQAPHPLPPLDWPEDAACGLEALLDLVAQHHRNQAHG